METKFSQFLRTGGNGEFVLAQAAGGLTARWTALSIKAEIPNIAALRDQFARNLERADILNRDLILKFLREGYNLPLEEDDLPGISGDAEDILANWEARITTLWQEWSERPSRFASLRHAMEDSLLASFRGLINERRQRALGVDQYIWWSQDDAKVRTLHAHYDDQVFNWDAPPHDGHPGQAHNCRCVAKPLLLDDDVYQPMSDQDFSRLVEGDAYRKGDELVVRDAVSSLGETLAAIPGFMDGASRYVDLRDKREAGTLTAADAEELSRLQANIDAVAADIERTLADIPGALTEAWRFRRDIRLFADEVAVAYFQGQATEGQLLAAHRDRGYADRAFSLGIAPFLIALRLPSVRERALLLPDRTSLERFWKDQSGAVRLRPIGVDWRREANPGIIWGGPIRQQGGPWEDRLEQRLGNDFQRLHPNFKKFDFQSVDTRTAVSAKTLNTNAVAYSLRPATVYSRLRRYVDQVGSFTRHELGGDIVRSETLISRRLELAIPEDATPRQLFEIQRAIDDAAERGIELEVTLIGR